MDLSGLGEDSRLCLDCQAILESVSRQEFWNLAWLGAYYVQRYGERKKCMYVHTHIGRVDTLYTT